MSSVEVIRRVYEALGAKDLDALAGLLASGVVITQDPRLPWGGRHVGHDGFGTFSSALVGTIDSAVTTEALFDADGQVIQYGRTRGTVRANDAAFDIPEVHIWTVRDGKVVEAHFAIDTPAMLAALEA